MPFHCRKIAGAIGGGDSDGKPFGARSGCSALSLLSPLLGRTVRFSWPQPRPRWKAAFDPSTAPAYDTANILIERSGGNFQSTGPFVPPRTVEYVPSPRSIPAPLELQECVAA